MTTNYKMEVLKTTIGNNLSNMFLETVAFNIATFLEESSAEKKRFTVRFTVRC